MAHDPSSGKGGGARQRDGRSVRVEEVEGGGGGAGPVSCVVRWWNLRNRASCNKNADTKVTMAYLFVSLNVPRTRGQC